MLPTRNTCPCSSESIKPAHCICLRGGLWLEGIANTLALDPANTKGGPARNVGSDSSSASPPAGVVAASSLVTKDQPHI